MLTFLLSFLHFFNFCFADFPLRLGNFSRQISSSNFNIPVIFDVKNADEFQSRVIHAKIPIIVEFSAELSAFKTALFIV